MPDIYSINFNYYTISLLVGAFTALLSGLLVFVQNKREQENQIWLALTISTAIWSFGYFLMTVSEAKGVALVSNWILHYAAIFIPLFYFLLVLVITNTYQKNKYIFWFFTLLAFVFVLLNTSSRFISDVVPKVGFNFAPVPGDLYIYFFAYFVILVLLGIVVTYGSIAHTDSRQERLRLWYTMIFTIVAAVGGGSVFATTFFDNVAPYPLLLFSLYPAISGYAILRFELFNAKVVATQMITYGLWTFIFIRVLLSELPTERLVNALLLVIVILFGQALIRSVKKEVGQREQLQKLTSQLRQTNSDLILRNRYLAALQALTNEITRSLDFKKFSQEIVDGVAEKLGFAGGILLTLNRDGETIELATMTNNRLFKKAVTFLPDVITSYTGNFKKDNTLTILAMRTGRVQIGSDLHSFISPPVPRGIALVIQNLLRIRSIMAVPIFSDNKVLGCLLVGSRSSKEQTANTEIQMVKALADEVGIVARNLILYERLEEANTKLKAANEQLERLDKAKTEFLSIASHQLRTPLTAIKGYVSMILEGDFGKMPGKFAEPLNDVFESAERLIALVNDLLDVSRIASGRMELHIQPVDLDKLTRDVIEEIMPKAEAKKIPLVLKNKMLKEALVQADPEKLRQVVINLIDNAIKYTENGQVIITFEGAGSHIRFSVKDNGIGISAEELPQLFHKFMRAPEAKLVEAEGTGLGLYVAKTVVESMGGKIWAESEGLGKGSRFIFELPAASKELREKTIKVENKNDYI